MLKIFKKHGLTCLAGNLFPSSCPCMKKDRVYQCGMGSTIKRVHGQFVWKMRSFFIAAWTLQSILLVFLERPACCGCLLGQPATGQPDCHCTHWCCSIHIYILSQLFGGLRQVRYITPAGVPKELSKNPFCNLPTFACWWCARWCCKSI